MALLNTNLHNTSENNSINKKYNCYYLYCIGNANNKKLPSSWLHILGIQWFSSIIPKIIYMIDPEYKSKTNNQKIIYENIDFYKQINNDAKNNDTIYKGSNNCMIIIRSQKIPSSYNIGLVFNGPHFGKLFPPMDDYWLDQMNDFDEKLKNNNHILIHNNAQYSSRILYDLERLVVDKDKINKIIEYSKDKNYRNIINMLTKNNTDDVSDFLTRELIDKIHDNELPRLIVTKNIYGLSLRYADISGNMILNTVTTNLYNELFPELTYVVNKLYEKYGNNIKLFSGSSSEPILLF